MPHATAFFRKKTYTVYGKLLLKHTACLIWLRYNPLLFPRFSNLTDHLGDMNYAFGLKIRHRSCVWGFGLASQISFSVYFFLRSFLPAADLI